MDLVDLNDFKQRVAEYRTCLNEARNDEANFKVEEQRFLKWISDSQIEMTEKLLDLYADREVDVTTAYIHLTTVLESLIPLLEARRVPLNDEYGTYQGDDYKHRHSGRYKFMYRNPDGGTEETSESEPICHRIYSDGRVVLNPSCILVCYYADSNLLQSVAREELNYGVANQRKDDACHAWKRYQDSLVAMKNSMSGVNSSRTNGTPTTFNQSVESLDAFREQLLDSGLPEDVVARKIQELKQKMGLG